MDNLITQESYETNLIGDVKNVTGMVDNEFLHAIEKLMTYYKVEYIHLYWKHFNQTASENAE